MAMVVLLTFAVTYLLLVTLPRHKAALVWCAVVFLLLAGAITPKDFFRLINWDVLFLFTGMAVLVELFIYSRAPHILAEKIVTLVPNLGLILFLLTVLSGFISMFMENVATFLIVAPLVFALAQKFPDKSWGGITLAAIAFSSNLQGSATLVGDPPSMILGRTVGLNFNDFFIFQNKPGIFFMVESAAVAAYIYLYFRFRKHSENFQPHSENAHLISIFPTILLVALLLTLSLINTPRISAGKWCLIFAAVGLGWFILFGHYRSDMQPILNFDLNTFLFLAGIFIIVGTVQNYGWMERAGNFLKNTVGQNKFLTLNIIIWFSVLVSGFVDNVPYILATLPVISALKPVFPNSQMLFSYGLLLGCTCGGNITPFGSTTGVVAWSMIRQKGGTLSFSEFFKFGFIFSIISVLAGEIFLLLFWY